MTHLSSLRNRRRPGRRYGFTLIEIMIVVGIIGLLAVAIIPNITTNQELARLRMIQQNLRKIDGAKNLWALENNKGGGETPSPEDLKVYDGWPKSLAYVYDYYDPTKVRIAIGGTIAPPGIWGIRDDAPRPRDLSVADGKVAYRLMYTESTQMQYGLMLVQMIAEDRIRVQVLVGSQAGDAEFDERAQVYVR